MSQSQQLNYDEPWPMFEDEDEPWKDLPRLLKWDGKMDTQMELGDAFGCTPSTISYWLDKARDEVDPEWDDEELQCLYSQVCGNLTIHPKMGICDVCLDMVRHNDSEENFDPDEAGSMTEHMAKLYDEYEDFAEKQRAAYETFQEKVSEDSKDSKEES